MADKLLDNGFANYPNAWDFVISESVHSTSPVTSAEIGITPDLDDALTYPPSYQGSPIAAANLVLDELAGDGGVIFATNVPAPPGPPIVGSSALTGLSGFFCPLYEGDLYDRIHMIPNTLNFGNVLQQQSRTVEVWNAFSVSKTLDSIAESGTQGLTLVRPGGAPSEPAVYTGLKSFVYTVQAAKTGPSRIDATYTFDFTSVALVLTILGERVVAFPFCYERPFREVLEFKTDILETENGNEQRIATRKLPRQLFRVRYLISDENERQRALNAIFGHHGNFFAVPLFHWARPLLQDASATDTTIFVDYSNADFRDTTAEKEHLLILWRSPTDFEIVQIGLNGLATPGEIDLELPLDGDHDAGVTLVVPMQFSLPKDPFKFEETQNNVITIDAQWLSNDYGDLADLSSLPTLDGIPILADPNLIDETLEQGFKINYDLFDSVGGDFQSIVGRTVPETQTFRGFEVRDDAAAFLLREILYGFQGKQKSFWLPSWRTDFTVTDDIGSSDLNIKIVESDFHRFVEDGPDPWSGIFIELFDGTQFFRTITATVAPSGGEETVTINSALGQAITVAEIRHAGLLIRSRFNQDRISIEHTQTGNIRVRIPVVGVKESA